MGEVTQFEQTALVMGLLCSRPGVLDNVLEILIEKYGPIHQLEGPFPFIFTNYYDEEMGTPIFRYFILFSNLIDPSTLVNIKHETNFIESQFAKEEKRVINLDPGILSAGNLILATTKNRSHRVPLHDGMYAEVTLLYKDKAFQSFDWTYADYKSDQFKALFKQLRSEYLKLLHAHS